MNEKETNISASKDSSLVQEVSSRTYSSSAKLSAERETPPPSSKAESKSKGRGKNKGRGKKTPPPLPTRAVLSSAAETPFPESAPSENKAKGKAPHSSAKTPSPKAPPTEPQEKGSPPSAEQDSTPLQRGSATVSPSAEQDSTAKKESSPAPLPPVEIREMSIDDLAGVFHLGERLFTPQDLPTSYRTWDEYEVIDFFSSEPELCLVAECNGDLAGFVLGSTIEKNRSSWKYGYLVWLGVEPSLSRQGIGHHLFKEFQRSMEKEGVRMLLVDTETDNEQAVRFFQKMGFTNPQEHVYMSLNLSHKKRRNSK